MIPVLAYKMGVITERVKTENINRGALSPSLKYLMAIMLLMAFFIGHAQSIPLKTTKITKSISMMVPGQFHRLTDEDMATLYPPARRPLAVFQSNDRNIELSVNLTQVRWAAGDIHILQSFYKANIINLFSEVNFIQEDIVNLNGKEYAIFEYTGTFTDDGGTFQGSTTTAKYSFILAAVYNEQLLLFNFTSPLRLRAAWQGAAREIMNSIKVTN